MKLQQFPNDIIHDSANRNISLNCFKQRIKEDLLTHIYEKIISWLQASLDPVVQHHH